MTDNEMRRAELKNKQAQTREQERSNRQNEKETRRSNRVKEQLQGAKVGVDLLSAGGKALGGLAKTAAMANDPSWYERNPGLAKDAASLSFFNPISGSLPVGEVEAFFQGEGEVTKVTVPSTRAWGHVSMAAILKVVPTFGTATGRAEDAVNVFTRLLYTNVRRANAGSAPYSACDLGIYFLLADSAYSFASYMLRIYGLLNYYTASNLAMPRWIIHALGCDFDDFQNHIADFRMFIRTYLMKLNTRKIPKDYTLLARHWQLFQGVYKDANADESKCQLYAYRPEGFYQYSTDSDGAGACVLVSCPNRFTYSTMVTYANNLIDSLFERQDVAIMSGDVEKAYGPENCYTVSMPDENYVVTPSYDLHMLMQIMNASHWSVDLSDTDVVGNNFNYWQNAAGNLRMGTGFVPRTTSGFNTDREFFNIASDASIEPKYILEYTRLRPAVRITRDEGSTVVGQSYESWGSELPTGFTIWTWNLNLTTYQDALQFTEVEDSYLLNSALGTDGIASEIAAYYTVSSRISAFDFPPIVKVCYGYMGASEAGNSADITHLVDYQNYTTITRSNLTKMHTAALLSQFTIV